MPNDPVRGSKGKPVRASGAKSSSGASARSGIRNSGGDGPRTRGGWTPAGTAAKRREVQLERGTERGQRTREEIIAAARKVFERDGYLEASIDDIVADAGVARGSFYTYFPTKLAVLKVLASRVGKQIREAVMFQPEDMDLDPVEALDQSHRRYIEVYRQNAGIYGLIEQLSTIDPELHNIRLSGRRNHVKRVATRIRRWQERGLADPTIEPTTTAAALVSMTSNTCYWCFVGQDRYDVDQLAVTVTELWVRSLDLQRRPRRAWLAR